MDAMFGRTLLMGLATVALCGLGCVQNGEPPPGQNVGPPPAAQFEPGLTLGTSEPLLEHGVTTKRVNFAHLRELWVRLKLPSMPSDVDVHLEFLAPNGEVFYQTTRHYSTDPSVTEVPGALHPVAVFHAKPITGGFALDYDIPIAGAVFTRDLRAGAWMVRARVDNQVFTTEMQVSVDR